MWPRQLPREIETNPLRASEVKVYRRIEKSLNNEWTVFYSRPWHGLTQYGEEIDGEADFIIAHARLGILALEVKGGAINFDPATNRWTSTDRHKIPHNIKDPVSQASSAKHQIIKALKSSPLWQSRWIRMRHGVVFPDSVMPRRSYGLDRPRYIFCDREDFTNDFPQWIHDRLSVHEAEDEPEIGTLGPDGLRALEKILAAPIELSVPLVNILDESENALEILTTDQFHLIETMEDLRRIAIRGGAGTGKTVLAMESAVRRAATGDKVLFLCFNRALAHKIRKKLEKTPVSVFSFHALCSDVANKAGLGVRQGKPEDDALSEALCDGLAQLKDYRFDAVIVDEGQDIRTHWWVCINELLRDDKSRMQVFYDSNQSIYPGAESIPSDLQIAPLRLKRNLRNTDEIHAAVMQFYDGIQVMASGIHGVPPVMIEVKGGGFEQIARAVAKHVKHLIHHDGLKPEEIVILAPTVDDAQHLAGFAELKALAPIACDEPEGDRLVLDSVGRFKGLESKAIVIAALPGFVGNRELAYVALSRPRTYLAIAGDTALLASLGLPTAA